MEKDAHRRCRMTVCKACKPVALVAAMTCAGLISPAYATNYVWFGGDGIWESALNWSPLGGPPGPADFVTFSAGSAAVTVDEFLASLTLSGGALGGAGDLAVSGLVSFTGGQIGGGGGQVIANGGLQITGATDKALGYTNAPVSSGIVNNAAGVWSGTGDIVTNGGGRLTNSAGASFDIQTDADMTGGILINHGTLIKSVGAVNGSDKTVLAATVLNDGTIVVQRGSVEVASSFDNAGTIDVAAGSRFQSTNFAFGNSGSIQGNGTIQPALDQILDNAGLISPGNSIGHLTIDGNLKSSGAASMKFELTNLASFDLLSVTGKATLGGDIGIWDLGYTPVVGDSFIVMTFDQRLDGSTFASVTLHDFSAGTQFDVIYHDHDVTLSVAAVPEPQTYLMILTGLGCIGWSIRRRLVV